MRRQKEGFSVLQIDNYEGFFRKGSGRIRELAVYILLFNKENRIRGEVDFGIPDTKN